MSENKQGLLAAGTGYLYRGILITALLCLLLTGCRGIIENGEVVENGKDTASLEEQERPPVIIRFMWWGNEERKERTDRAVELFMEKNPDIIVQTLSYPFEDYYENLDIMAEAGYMPDVWQGFVGANSGYMNAGLVEALDPYVQSGMIDLTEIPEEFVENGRIDGKLYGLSLGCNVKCMAVDTEKFEQAGLQIPEKFYSSWEKLEQDLLVLKEAGTENLCGNILNRPFAFEYYARQNGETMFGAPDILSIGFSRETYVDYYQMKLRWDELGLSRPYEEILADNYADIEDNREYAVYLLYSNQLEELFQKHGQKMQVLLLPGPNTTGGTDIRPGIHICMSSVSAQKEAAARLIDFFINDVEANRILNAERGIPISGQVREALMSELSGARRQMAQIVDLAETYSSPSNPTIVIDMTPIEGEQNGGIMEDMEQKIMYGQVTPEEAYDLIYEKYGLK